MKTILKNMFAAICLACSLAVTPAFGYNATVNNSYMFEVNGKQYALGMLEDEFGYYLLVLKQSGNTWLAVLPYVDSYVGNDAIAAAGGAHAYLVSKLPEATMIFRNAELPQCPPTSTDKAANIGYDLGAGDVRYNPTTKQFEMVKTEPPLSHVTNCPQ